MSEKKRKSSKDDYDEDRKERKEEKKARKKAEKVAKMLGYTDDNNPFGDSNLLQPFTWAKKKEKDSMTKKTTDEDPELARLKLISEIENVRKRRVDRENELAEIERLRDEEQRLREASLYGDWQKKEEEFHLEQTKERSKIRLLGNREKPIDLIAKNILLIDAAANVDKRDNDTEYTTAKNVSLLELDVEIRNPLSIVGELPPADLAALVDDISGYLQLEQLDGRGQYAAFWEALREVAAADLRSLRAGTADGPRRSVHSAVEKDVQQLLQGKDRPQLDDMEADIEKSIAQGKTRDLEYWEHLLSEVRVQRSRSVVTDTHISLLQKQLQVLSTLRAELRRQALLRPSQPDLADRRPKPLESLPELLDKDGMELDEQMQLQDEIQLPGSTYWWQDKYRPRKPRYLNRVKTGWDWNKYNQTHYDFDNPPPKIIQGYKFTVFYPDLIDKTVTPKYLLQPSGDGEEFVIIRFTAGPPYEDLAFKIINREWDIHRKSGFRSVFERGVLQLHFNFKRSFYRR